MRCEGGPRCATVVNIPLTIGCYNWGCFNKRGEMVYYPNILERIGSQC